MSPFWTCRQDQEILIWEDLCEAAGRLGMEVREEIFDDEARTAGGLVRLGNRHMVLVEKRLPQGKKNRILGNILRSCGVESIFMPPYLRQWLESH